MWRWMIAGAVVAAALVLAMPGLFSRQPSLKAGENGIFANDCCGTVELVDGKMLLNGGQAVRYIVGKDAEGAYVLPRTFVGAVPDWGFDVDGTRSVRKLRLDRMPVPTKIMLYQGLSPYIFVRQAQRPGRR
ncbi:hypothetical protein [Sphingomonas quercus]|uniref:Uncharacterized protein n=1 Tax=Sphingomonas quercus TaxID=2842451 RepID=A0ABS6BKF1_9SPHN|nr:hypothetical protein [Sphingomonas quercus]MBU3078780.1 hypothetical protein [Sphingomonas quercus]